MTPTLISLIILAAVAVAVAGYSLVTERQRRAVMDRTVADGGAYTGPSITIAGRTAGTPLAARLARYAPRRWVDDPKSLDKLVQAGYESPTAPLVYASTRLAVLVLLPVFAFIIGMHATFTKAVLFACIAGAVAFVLPVGYVDRRIRMRQTRIRKGIPDALDLMVVCVEAGVSLDAAILRVSRELGATHPDVSYEFLVVNRKSNAGMTREEALRGLWTRTGVEELRTLVSSMVQSEKWGTSISNVLRVAAETLRRKRRQAAEKQAAMAPIKMTIPLVVLILPTLFIVIMGPVILQAMITFR